MDDRKDDNIWIEDLTEEPKSKRQPNRRKILLLLLILAVMTVVLASAWRDGTGFDSLRRWALYGGSETVLETGYTYDDVSSNRFAAIGDHLAVLSSMQLSVLSDSGTIWFANVHMTAPALVSNATRAVAWDIGGQDWYVVSKNGEELSMTAEEPLLAITINGSGWIAVTGEQSNYKAAVTVYNAALDEVFVFHSSERFLSTAAVTEDCRYLASAALAQEDSAFVSQIIFYDLSEKEPYATYNIVDSLVMDLGSVSGTLTAVTESQLAFLTPQDGVKATYDYNSLYLREYSLSGDDFAALLLNQHKSGSLGRLVTVDNSGKEIASLDVNEQILDVSAAGRYLAVLYTDRCVIYTAHLEEYAVQYDEGNIKAVRLRSDGSALLLSSNSATLFLP